MTGLLKVGGVAGGRFVSCRETNAVDTEDVNNDVVLSFEAEVSPTAHASGIGRGMMATTCPARG